MEEKPSRDRKSLMLVRTSTTCCPRSSNRVSCCAGTGAAAATLRRYSCRSLMKALPHVATVTTAPPPARADTVPAPAIECEYRALASTCRNAVSSPDGCISRKIPVEIVQNQGTWTAELTSDSKPPCDPSAWAGSRMALRVGLL